MASNGIDRTGAAGGSGAASLIGALAELTDPGVDSVIFWDQSAGGFGWYTLDSAAFRTAAGLAIGTNVQAYDAGLAAIAALAKTDGNVIVGDGTTWVAESGSTARTSLGAAASGSNSDITGLSAVASGSVFRKNAIINGDFQVWQDGTSFTSVASGTYTADQWEYSKSGAMVHDISRSTDVPTVAQAGRLFSYSMLIDCTTADTSIAAGDYNILVQYVEGYNWLPLAQQACTLSFWVKATKTGTYCVAFTNSGADRSYVAEYTVNATDTWEKKTINISASPSAGTWDYTTGTGLQIRFALAAGSTFQTTADAWQTGNFITTSNQVNACDSASNNFRITGVQLEAGSTATAFEYRTIQDELELCQRYYEKSFDYGTAPAQNIGFNSAGCVFMLAGNTSTYGHLRFAVPKRATPTITTYNTAAANANARNQSNAGDATLGTNAIGTHGLNFSLSSPTDNNSYQFHWVASARL